MRRLVTPILLAIAVTLAAAPTGCAKRAVAKVNGDMITEQEFYSKLEDAGGRQVLDRLILEHLIAQKAKEKKVQVTEAELNQALNDVKQRVGADRWQEFIKSSGQSEDSIKNDLKQNLLLAKVLITEPELEKYYQENKTRFDEPAQAKYRRIILKSKEEADTVRQDIVAGKLDFAQAVKEKSEDAMKSQGGEIGPVSEGFGDPSVAKLLFTLALNEVSEPIPSSYPQGSYQIIQVVQRTEGKKHALPEVRTRVMQSMLAMRQQELSKLLNDLRAGANITILRPRYQSLAEQYAKLKEQKPPEIPSAGPTPPSPTPPRPPAPSKAPAPPAPKPAEPQ